MVRREFIRRATSWILWGALIAIAQLGGTASAQTDAPQYPPVGTVTKQLFPDGPAGNGYADLVLAGEYVRSSQLFLQLAEKLPKATLSEKRKALEDPPIVKGLGLLRQALAKKIESPHREIDEETVFPEFTVFRHLGRVLMVEQYVLLADGKVSQAIGSLRDGLRVGYAIQCGSLINGLVGIAVDSLVLDRLARHIDQLSVRDCDRLVALANEWMGMADPSISIFEGERDALIGIWKKYRASGDMSKLLEGLTAGGAQDDDVKQVRFEVDAARKSGGSTYDDLLASCISRTTSYFDLAINNLKLSPWERREIPDPERDSLAGRLCNMLLPVTNNAGDRFVQEQAKVQILGVHAAIRKYRWENDQLPAKLDLLNVGRLIVDPFTGSPLRYQVTGETTYELSSAGPVARTEEDKAKGARVPIYLPRKAQ